MSAMNPEAFGPVPGNQVENKKAHEQLLQVGKINLFLFFILLLVITCSLIFEEQMVLGSIILETAILVITLGWIGLQGMDYREILKPKLPGLKKTGVTLIIVTCGIYVASYIDLLFRYILQNWGKVVPPNLPKTQGLSELLLSLVAIAILPALAEEILFRGFILQNYRKILGNGKAIFISALLFGMAHLNIQNFWGPFILGLLCGWLVCLYDSIILACLGHLLNNGLIFTVSYLIPDFGSVRPITGSDLVIQIPAFVISGIILFILLLRYNAKIPQKPVKSGKLLTVLCHWSTWLLLMTFSIFAALQFLMMKL
ncbi:MAG TPA: hypothetical protein DDW50_03065 [Firmicutes bacterium]|nr:hypothetical protein [Bacillota bacterium]